VAKKIRKENYEICLEVNPTLAGRHQRNHHAALLLFILRRCSAVHVLLLLFIFCLR